MQKGCTQPFHFIFVCCCRFFILSCQSKIPTTLFYSRNPFMCEILFLCVQFSPPLYREGRVKVFRWRAQLQIHSFGFAKSSLYDTLSVSTHLARTTELTEWLLTWFGCGYLKTHSRHFHNSQITWRPVSFPFVQNTLQVKFLWLGLFPVILAICQREINKKQQYKCDCHFLGFVVLNVQYYTDIWD
jgi:hypothetical protein